jgi:cobalamin-dependent methionine synthase I
MDNGCRQMLWWDFILLILLEMIFILQNGKEEVVLHTIRQQTRKPERHYNIALADFILPKPQTDYIGAFAVTAGIGIEKKLAEFEKST